MKPILKSQLLMAACFVVASAVPAWGAPNSQLNDAIREYNSRNYGAAVQKLEAIVRAQPNNSLAHYYLATSYQSLQRLDDAKREYTWNYQHKKDPSLAYKSWQGLLGLERAHSRPASPVSHAESAATSFNSGGPDHPPTIGGAPVQKSVPFQSNYEFQGGCPRHDGRM